MTIDEILAGVDARLTEWETAIRNTPRRGPVLLSDGTRVGHARRLNGRAWDRIAADWRAVCADSEPVKGEAAA